jgi:hypothetical protein
MRRPDCELMSDADRTNTPFPRRGFYSCDQPIIGVAICQKLTKIGSSRLAFDGTIDSVANLDKQSLFAHPG